MISHAASTATTRGEATDILKPIWNAQQNVHKKYCGNIGLDDKEENVYCT